MVKLFENSLRVLHKSMLNNSILIVNIIEVCTFIENLHLTTLHSKHKFSNYDVLILDFIT